MKKRDLKVGMKVRIKSWKDMKKGVGIKDDEYKIKFPSSQWVFLDIMKPLCGRIAIVKNIGACIKLDFDNKDNNADQWCYIPQMLEPVIDEKIEQKVEESKKQSFTVANLRFGNVVELRKGDLCLIEPKNSHETNGKFD